MSGAAAYRGVRVGDRVSVTIQGYVVALGSRDGEPAVEVVLDDEAGTVWASTIETVILNRALDPAVLDAIRAVQARLKAAGGPGDT